MLKTSNSLKKLYPIIFFIFFLVGCSDTSEPLREPYFKTIVIINNSESEFTVKYLSAIDEAIWMWETDEYEYETKVIPEFENKSVTILVSEYDEYDILTFSNDENEAEIIGYWREFGTIIVGFVNDEFVFDYR